MVVRQTCGGLLIIADKSYTGMVTGIICKDRNTKCFNYVKLDA